MIQAGAALPGKYALKSSYTPGVSFEIPASLNFLAPVELSIPKGTDPAKTIPLSWKPVPGAVGYVAMAVASKGRNRSVMWTSVETDGTQFPVDFNSPEKVKELIEKGLCMPPDKTQCNIPATAFEGCDGVSIQLFAFGPAFEQAGSTPSVRVQTRSMAMMVLQKGQD
jgi:hypothetical protein